MYNTDFYYGLPQELWDNLIEKAEDIFSENEIGTHIVGIYPAGKRIYGCEPESQGLLCLYIDSIDNIIDPTFNTFSYEYTVNNQNSNIWFIELREYISWLFKNVYKLNKKLIRSDWQDNCFHLIPSLHDSFAEDSSISNIICYIQLLNNLNTESYYIPHGYANKNKIYSLLSGRARILWYDKKTFNPNINKKWGKVDYFNSKVDDNFIEMVCNNNIDVQLISNYSSFLNKLIYTLKINKSKNLFLNNKVETIEMKTEKSIKITNSINKEIIKLYRSLC